MSTLSNRVIFQTKNIQNNMFQGFITSPENNDTFNRQSAVLSNQGAPNEAKLVTQIKNIIESLPSEEICQQAALNIGLSRGMLDFDKILKLVTTESSQGSHNFTLLQLKSLQKEAEKIKKTASLANNNCKEVIKYNIRRVASRQNLRIDEVDKQKVLESSQEKLKKALQEELELRNKVHRFYSTDKLRAKQCRLKQKMQKVKEMNKKAMKVYKTYKEKEEQIIQSLKVEATATPLFKQKIKQKLRPKFHKKTVIEQQEQIQEEHSSQKLRIYQDELLYNESKAKTAMTKRRNKFHIKSLTYEEISPFKNERFEEYRQRELKTRQKRNEIDSEKEQQAIIRVIKKQNKLIEVKKQVETQEQVEKKMLKTQHNELAKQAWQENSEQLSNEIKQKCLEKQFKKQMQLQERINRIREEFKIKEERMEKHRQQQSIEMEDKNILNEKYQAIHILGAKNARQVNKRHELTIKQRHDQRIEKQNQDKITKSINKLTDKEIIKYLQRIRNKQIVQSIVNFKIV